MTRLALVLVLCCGLASASRADTLLGTFSYQLGGGGGWLSANQLASFSIELGYSIEIVGGVCQVHRIGCEEIPLAKLVTGATFTYDSTSTHFPEIAGRLTNGIVDSLGFANRMLSTSHTMMFANGGGGTPEPVAFGTATDFVGFKVTSIECHLDLWELGDATVCGGQPGGICYNSEVTWRFYGHSIQVAAIPSTWGRVKSNYR